MITRSVFFVNGDKVKYAYGLTFIFIGLDPLDNTWAYCLHPNKKLCKLPLDRLKRCA